MGISWLLGAAKLQSALVADNPCYTAVANHLASTDNLPKPTNTHEHIAEYNHTKRNPTQRRYAMNTREKILGYINRKDRRSRSLDLLTPRRSNSALPLHTQKQCTARGSSWGLSSLSLTTEGSWIHFLGEGRQASRQPSDASSPWKYIRICASA